MSTYNARLLAKQAADYLQYKIDKDSSKFAGTQFLDSSNNNLGTNGFSEDILNRIRGLTHMAKELRQKGMTFSDAISSAEKDSTIGKQGVDKLKELEVFSDSFKGYTGLEVSHFSDAQFDIPSPQQLGWSYRSNTGYVDPRWHTVGKPDNAYVKTFDPYVIRGIPYTTEYIRTNFYRIMGSSSDFNRQQGVIDQADLRQEETHGNYITRTWGMKITPRNKWVTDQMEVQGIPDFAYANAGYWMELRQDDHMAWGDPRSEVYGIENCEAAVLDLSSLGTITGLGDGLYEATAFTNLWKAIVLSIVQTESNYTKVISKIVIPKNMYQYFSVLERSYMATPANANNVGSIASGRRFLAELADILTPLNGGNVEIIQGPVELSSILIFWGYSSQTFSALEWYMSPTVGNITATFEGAPANFSTEMVVTMSEIINRNSENMLRVKLPDIANFKVLRREYILSGSGDFNPINIGPVTPVKDFSVSPNAATVEEGDDTVFTVTLSGGLEASTITATSSNTATATVAVTGTAITVTGVAAGNATITISSSDADVTKTAPVSVTVTAP